MSKLNDDGSSEWKEECVRQDTTADCDSSDFCEIPVDSCRDDDLINPPPSCMERVRDRCLTILGGKVHNWIAIVVVILIAIDGAFFFFLLIGAHGMCHSPSRWNCDPRNDCYNFSIQALNVLFTYLAIVSLPWKLAHAAHLSKHGKRSCDVGLDLYGQPTEETWFHISPPKRRWIVAFLIANSLTQYANQASRIVYYNYELQSTYPGALWTNVFFVLSFLCAIVAGVHQFYEETKLRKENPNKFPPGPLEIGKEYLQAVCCSKTTTTTTNNPANDDDEEAFPEREERREKVTPSQRRKWFTSNKTNLEMWGL